MHRYKITVSRNAKDRSARSAARGNTPSALMIVNRASAAVFFSAALAEWKFAQNETREEGRTLAEG